MQNKYSWLCLIFSLSLAPAGWSEEQHRVGVVLESRGAIFRHADNTPAQRLLPVKVLTSLHNRDQLELGPSSSLTLSILEDSSRLRLTGPLKIQLNKGSLPQGPGIELLPSTGERKAVVADMKVNLAKLGGFSSRSLGTTVRVDRADPELDLDAVHKDFESSTLEVKVSPAENPPSPSWTTVKGTLLHGPGRDRLKLQLPLEPGKACWVYWGDEAVPRLDSVQFTVVRVEDAHLNRLRAWEAGAQGLAERLEAAEAYRRTGLYDAAESSLQKLQKDFPEGLDWPSYWSGFHEERRVRKL